ncbi:molybdopterin synthase [halophilic archaeon]|nr:molybdopterin synthase [halophilic archaeon]
MQIVGVCGPGADRVGDRLAARLGDAGRVATVERGAVDATDASAETASTAVELRADQWRARGGRRDLPEVLDDLAPDHDYAVVVGFPDARVPQVALGDADPAGEVLVDATDADALDLDGVRDALDAVEPYETLESLVERAKSSPDADRSGAIATFTGRVRAKDGPDDDPTEYLEFQKYETVADERMAAIREELEARDGVFEVLLHHRTGVVEAGEDIVFVVVLAGHREEAFRTVEDGIDRLKAEVPLFKKEVTTDEEFWVHKRS